MAMLFSLSLPSIRTSYKIKIFTFFFFFSARQNSEIIRLLLKLALGVTMSRAAMASSISDRARGAYWGGLIADSLALPVHWYYNPADIVKQFGRITGFRPPASHHPSSIMSLSNTGGAGRGGQTGSIIVRSKHSRVAQESSLPLSPLHHQPPHLYRAMLLITGRKNTGGFQGCTITKV